MKPTKTTIKKDSADVLFDELFGVEANDAARKQREQEMDKYKALWSTPEKIEELYGKATPDIERWHDWMMTRFYSDGSPVVPKWIDSAPSSCDGCGKCCTTPVAGRTYRIPIDVRKDPMVVPYTDPETQHGPIVAMKMCGDHCAQLQPDKRCGIYAFRPTLCREYPRGSQQCRAFCGDMKKHWNEVAQLDHHFWDNIKIEFFAAVVERHPNIAFGDTEVKKSFVRKELESLIRVTKASRNGLKDFVSIGDALQILNEMPVFAIRYPGMTLELWRDKYNKPVKYDVEETINIDAEAFSC